MWLLAMILDSADVDNAVELEMGSESNSCLLFTIPNPVKNSKLNKRD